jgi:tRNA threonylcarbamoyl adenosine modification protein YjeE
MTYTTESAEDTKRVANDVAQILHGGECISLVGDLGAGKTTFVQGLVAALGSSSRVTSPTFTVMNEYRTRHPSIHRVVHCDFYRFTDVRHVDALELEAYRSSDTIILVEWPNILPDMTWTPDIVISIAHGGGDVRTIEVSLI